MDHNEAIRSQACEKYLLGELSLELRDAFEEHYFSCSECAAQLKAAADFAAASRDIFAAAPASEPQPDYVSAPRGWFRWIPSLVAGPAFAALLLLIAYQNFVSIPRLKQTAAPRVLAMYSLISADSRGDEGLVFSVQPDEPFGLYVDVPASSSYNSYSLRLLDPAGSSTFLRSVSASDAQKTQVVILNPHQQAGQYVLIVSGLAPDSGSQHELARLRFTVELRR